VAQDRKTFYQRQVEKLENKPAFGYLLLAGFLISLLVNVVTGVKTVAEVFDYLKGKPDNRMFFTAVIKNTNAIPMGIVPTCRYEMREATPYSLSHHGYEPSRLLPVNKKKGFYLTPSASSEYRFLVSEKHREIVERGAAHISVMIWQSNGPPTDVEGPFKLGAAIVIPLKGP
jgi:hypothetical protein